MKKAWRSTVRLCLFFLLFFLFAGFSRAGTLFEDRRIYLSNDKNRVFRIGITGTTAGYNYIALIENAEQESISLGDLGYWERVPDPPSFLRNYDLQFIVKNRHKGQFQIEFEYDEHRQGINYRIKEGSIEVRLDNSGYYPALVIHSIASGSRAITKKGIEDQPGNLLFFDFNSFDVDLRKYYGKIKQLISDTDTSPYFYCYESGGYNPYYFRIYKDVTRLDTDKMGLSPEDGTIEYYQKILDNLKSRFGTEFSGKVTVISRYGHHFSKELKRYASEIGFSEDMAVTFRAYGDIP